MSVPARRYPAAPAQNGASNMTRRRIYDARLDMFTVRVQPGECYTTAASDEAIVTVLGSCVAACIRDPRTGFGGLNHFMLPASETGDWSGFSAVLRYGNHAMELLINAVLKTGCRRENLEIKLFGGADLTEGPSRVGSKNAAFVLKYLEDEGISAVSADLGGTHPRVIQYVPATGVARRIFRKRADEDRIIAERERRYTREIGVKPPEGDIELFDEQLP